MIGLTPAVSIQKKSIQFYVTISITMTVLLSIYSTIIYLKFRNLSYVIRLYFVLLIVTGVYVNILSIFSFLLYNVKIRFKVLNKVLRWDLDHYASHYYNFNQTICCRRSFESNRKITNVKVIGDEACDAIIKIARLHGQLNDIIDDTNSCYSVQVVVF